MNWKIITAFLTLILLVPFARARLGDTEAQLEKRYGKPADNTPELSPESGRLGMKVYSYAGMSVMVTLRDGKSWTEQFIRTDGKNFSDGQVAKILNLSGGAKKWTLKKGSDPSKKEWIMEGGEISAQWLWNAKSGAVMITGAGTEKEPVKMKKTEK